MVTCPVVTVVIPSTALLDSNSVIVPTPLVTSTFADVICANVDVPEVTSPVISPTNLVAVITPTDCKLLILAVAFVIIALPTKVAPEAYK